MNIKNHIKKIYLNQSGLTLTELMVVVAVLAILMAFASVFLRPQLLKANDTKRKAEIKRISVAVEEYEKDNDCYPPVSLLTCTPTGTGLVPYLDRIRCDPVSRESYYYEVDTTTTCAKWYRFYAKLDNEKDVDYQPGIGPSNAYSYVYTSPNAPALVSGGVTYWGYTGGNCQQLPNGSECWPNYDSLSNCLKMQLPENVGGCTQYPCNRCN